MSRRSDMKRLMESPVSDQSENTETDDKSVGYGDLSADSPAASSSRPKRAARSFSEAWKASQADADAKQRLSADAAIDLDPNTLKASLAADRVADSSDPSFAQFVENIREHGQQIPILVRQIGTGEYQIAYGHRRARAAKDLGRPVRAVVRALTDAELVLAQASENLERRDLSYIERAFFAFNMAEAGIARDVIQTAMGADDAQVSRYIKVAQSIPKVILDAIGPAPKVGRPRWDELVERIKIIDEATNPASRNASAADENTKPEDQADTASVVKAKAVIVASGFDKKPTDERFAAVFDALAAKAIVKSGRSRIWKDGSGRKIVRIEETATRFNLSIDRKLEPELGEFLVERLDELLSAFKARKDKPVPQPKLKGDEEPE